MKKIATRETLPPVPVSTLTMVEFRHLRRAPENVRHTDPSKDIDPLADNIAANGLLQSLIGYREGKKAQVWIVGGGRRLQALSRLVDRFQIDLGFLVPVLIRDREEAVELSLSENLERHDMNPADEFEAFATLMKRGDRSPADLAKRFGYTERYVKQRLRLAELAPEILNGLRKGEMTLDGALAYARTPDPVVQAVVFKSQQKRSWDKHDPKAIRNAISGEAKRTDWSLYRYIGAEAYERAGGGYDEGLFEDVAEGADRRLSAQHLVIKIAQDHIDFQMIGRLKEMAATRDCETVSGYVVYPDLSFPSWGMNPPKAPEGFAWVGDAYNREFVDRMWKTIRNNRIDVRLLVGIEDDQLIAYPRGFFVAKDQKNAVQPAVPPAPPRPAATPEEIAATERRHAVELWSKRLAVGVIEGSFLDGRAYWPSSWAGKNPDRTTIGGKSGWLVPLNVFVSDDEVAAQASAAPERYDRYLREQAEAAETKRIADQEAEEQLAARRAELEAMEPPAVVVVDGEAWVRNDEGAYEPIDDPDNGWIDNWKQLLEELDVAADGTVFDTREAFDAAHAETKAAA